MIITEHDAAKFARYVVGGTEYRQLPMVAGQTMALINLIGTAISKQVDPETKKPKVTVEGIFESITSDFLAEFLGIVLLKDSQQAEELAQVPSFTERGKPFVWTFPLGIVKEVVQDFFVLNKAEIGPILALLGVNPSELRQQMSDAFAQTSTG